MEFYLRMNLFFILRKVTIFVYLFKGSLSFYFSYNGNRDPIYISTYLKSRKILRDFFIRWLIVNLYISL